MKALESYKDDLLKMAVEMREKGYSTAEIEKALLHYLLDLRKNRELSIPELDDLAKRLNSLNDSLKKKNSDLESISSSIGTFSSSSKQ